MTRRKRLLIGTALLASGSGLFGLGFLLGKSDSQNQEVAGPPTTWPSLIETLFPPDQNPYTTSSTIPTVVSPETSTTFLPIETTITTPQVTTTYAELAVESTATTLLAEVGQEVLPPVIPGQLCSLDLSELVPEYGNSISAVGVDGTARVWLGHSWDDNGIQMSDVEFEDLTHYQTAQSFASNQAGQGTLDDYINVLKVVADTDKDLGTEIRLYRDVAGGQYLSVRYDQSLSPNSTCSYASGL